MDNIRPKLLKAYSNELANRLAHIANLSFQNGDYPDQFKIAKVIPLFKKGEPHLAQNYIPINLISIPNKIFEKFIYRCRHGFLQKYNTLYKIQFGFHERYSTMLVNIEIVENIREEILEGNFVLS